MKQFLLIASGLLLAACALGAQPDLPSIGGGTTGNGSGGGFDLPGNGDGAAGTCNGGGAGAAGADSGGASGEPKPVECSK